MSSKKIKPADAPAKGGRVIAKIALALALMGAGGGGAYALVQTGVIGHAEPQDNRPKLVRKGEADPYAPKAEGTDAANALEVDGEGGSEYRTSYYSFAEDFTSNLKNSDGLIQVSLAASTRRDGRVLMWMKKHELAIRSALLTVLADTPESDVFTLDGKHRLQQRLTAAINRVLMANEGFGGVDAVFFKSFVVQ